MKTFIRLILESIITILTKYCHNTCKYCYNWAGGYTPYPLALETLDETAKQNTEGAISALKTVNGPQCNSKSEFMCATSNLCIPKYLLCDKIVSW